MPSWHLHWIRATESRSDSVTLPITGTASYTMLAGSTTPTDKSGNEGSVVKIELHADFVLQNVDTIIEVVSK